MTHTIISWDCSYRNFFHIIDGLLLQDYPKEEFELIYIEQRSKKVANKHNRSLGLSSLEDRYREVKNKLNIKIIYLDEPGTVPFHWGRCNNAGLSIAKGKIISVMDGDQLLPRDFLIKLQNFHERSPDAVINIYRKMAQYPAGVKSYKKWFEASNDFHKCLNTCLNKNSTVPKNAGNKGPMISARKEYWDKIGGYDPHKIWSTSLSKLGGDVNKRLEIATGSQSVCLPNCFTVHPWHPRGTESLRQNESILKYFSFQDKLTDWSTKHNEPHHKKRLLLADKIYKENKKSIEMIRSLYHIDETKNDVILKSILKIKFQNQYARLKGIIYRIRIKYKLL